MTARTAETLVMRAGFVASMLLAAAVVAGAAERAAATPRAAAPAAGGATVTFPVLPVGRPDLWDQYEAARKVNTERNDDAVARQYGFPSASALHSWERDARHEAAHERRAGGVRDGGLVSLLVDAPGAHITSGYGVRVDPLGGGLSTHTGIDVGAPTGATIHAVAAGRVVQATYDGGYGFMVEIEQADGTRSRYCHASALLVERGAEVSAGDAVALVGSTGRSTGSHVHFEVRKHGVPMNPLRALRSWRR